MKINIDRDRELIKKKVLLENEKIKTNYMNKYIRDPSGNYLPNVNETSLKNGKLIGTYD